MYYDLPLIHEFCEELDLHSVFRSHDELAIEIEDGIFLQFFDAEEKDDTMAGLGAEWHWHGDSSLLVEPALPAEFNCLDVVAGIKNGSLLICETRRKGVLHERELVHRDFHDEFRWMQEGEEIRIRRAVPPRREGTSASSQTCTNCLILSRRASCSTSN